MNRATPSSLLPRCVFVLSSFVLSSCGELRGVEPIWEVRLTTGTCAPPPTFGNRFWSEQIDEEDRTFPDPDTVDARTGTRLRFAPQLSTAGTEDSFLDCAVDGDDVVCDPFGEPVDDTRFHLQLRARRSGDARLDGEVDVVQVRTAVGAPGPDTAVVLCEERWTFAATRIVDEVVQGSLASERCDAPPPTGSPDGAAVTIFIANNSASRINVTTLDGGVLTTAEPAGGTAIPTTLGTVLRLVDFESGDRCVDIVEVTEDQQLIIVHGSQDAFEAR